MSSLLSLGISAEDRELLLRGLHEGKYNLLLGAGASYGCYGGDGVELKDGATVSQQIADAFSLNVNAVEAKKLNLTYESNKYTHALAQDYALSLFNQFRITCCCICPGQHS